MESEGGNWEMNHERFIGWDEVLRLQPWKWEIMMDLSEIHL